MRDVKCPVCQKLLCRMAGQHGSVVELKCNGNFCGGALVQVDEHGVVRVKESGKRVLRRAS